MTSYLRGVWADADTTLSFGRVDAPWLALVAMYAAWLVVKDGLTALPGDVRFPCSS